jgi:hypothetical protein
MRPSQKTSPSAQNAKRPRVGSPEKPSATYPTTLTPSSDRHSRAAKDQANKRFGVQAKELAELNFQAALTNSGTGRLRAVATTSTPLVVGTRSSARLRGTQGDEWQPIPEEWLKEVKQTRTTRRLEVKTGLETDEESVSELTDLSEDNSEPPSLSLERELNGHYDDADEDHENHCGSEQTLPKDFVEWETVCYFWPQFALIFMFL